MERAQEISNHLQNMNLERKFDGIAEKYINLLPRFREKLGHGYFGLYLNVNMRPILCLKIDWI